MTEFNEFFSQTFYGNSLMAWSISLGIILFSSIIGKVVYWFFSTVVRVFTSKTKTRLDDIIVDMVEEPIVLAIIVTGIWFALSLLVLPDMAASAVSHSYSLILAILAGWMASRLFDALYLEYLVPWAEKTDNDLDDQLMPILRKGIKMIIWILAIIIGLNNAGYDVGALIAGLGIGGLALAMAAKDTVSNVFGGVTIFTDKPFRLKDRIIVSGYDGTVEEIGVRSTRLKTLAGRIVTIPNAKFADAPVENISAEPSRKIVLDLGMTYETTPDQMQDAMDTLKSINDSNDSTEEKTVVAFSGFGDFSLNIKFTYYIKKGEDVAATQSFTNMAILRQFNDKGLEFAFPTQTLYTIQQT
jgi:MscS family membrane protein